MVPVLDEFEMGICFGNETGMEAKLVVRGIKTGVEIGMDGDEIGL